MMMDNVQLSQSGPIYPRRRDEYDYGEAIKEACIEDMLRETLIPPRYCEAVDRDSD